EIRARDPDRSRKTGNLIVLARAGRSGRDDGLDLDEAAEAVDVVQVQADRLLPEEQPPRLLTMPRTPSTGSSARRRAWGSSTGTSSYSLGRAAQASAHTYATSVAGRPRSSRSFNRPRATAKYVSRCSKR